MIIMINMIKLTFQRVALNFSSLFTTPLTLILLISIPTLYCLSATVIAPINYQIGCILASSVIIVSIVNYGTVAGSFRRSTLNKNSNLTIGIRWIDNLTTVITMIIAGLITLTYCLLILSLFDNMGILIREHWSGQDLSFARSISWSSIYYQSFLLILISYSISYLFQGFFDSDMMFFTMAIVIQLLLLILGATTNNFFRITSHRDGLFHSGYYIKMKKTLLGSWSFVPSLLFPFYAPTQFMALSGDLLSHGDYDKSLVWEWIKPETYSGFWLSKISFDSWKFNVLYFVPYIHILFWWLTGFTYKEIKR